MSETAPQDRRPPREARTPVAALAAAPVGILLALVAIGIGAVLIQDALSHTGVVNRSWLVFAVTSATGTGPRLWMVPVGVVLALVGLWLIFVGVKPRRRTGIGIQADSNTPIWLRPTDVARLAADTARRTPGVRDASASATSRAVRVKVSSTSTSPPGSIGEQVGAAVTDRFAVLVSQPRVSVQAHTEGGDRS